MGDVEGVADRPELGRVAEDALHVAGRAEHLALAVQQRHGVRDVLEHLPEAVLADDERVRHLLRLGQVTEVHHDAPDGRLVQQVRRDRLDHPALTVGTHDPELQRHRRARDRSGVDERLGHDLPVGVVHQLERVEPEARADRPTGEALGAGRHVRQPADVVEHDDGVDVVADERLEPRLALGERPLGLALPRDVTAHGQDAVALTVRVDHRRLVEVAPEAGAVRALEVLLPAHPVEVAAQQLHDLASGADELVGVQQAQCVGERPHVVVDVEELGRRLVREHLLALEVDDPRRHRRLREEAPEAPDVAPVVGDRRGHDAGRQAVEPLARRLPRGGCVPGGVDGVGHGRLARLTGRRERERCAPAARRPRRAHRRPWRRRRPSHRGP